MARGICYRAGWLSGSEKPLSLCHTVGISAQPLPQGTRKNNTHLAGKKIWYICQTRLHSLLVTLYLCHKLSGQLNELFRVPAMTRQCVDALTCSRGLPSRVIHFQRMRKQL